MAWNVAETVGGGYGVVLVRITVLDDHGHRVIPQPSGRFQVWLVTGDVRMLHAVDSPHEAASWLNAEEQSMFRKLASDELPTHNLEL